jgi:hypothetical protein
MYIVKRKFGIVGTNPNLEEAITLFLNTVGPNEGKDTEEARALIRDFLAKDGRFQWGPVAIEADIDLQFEEEEPTCTNPEMHAKYAERGIEDQCGYCKIDPSRL